MSTKNTSREQLGSRLGFLLLSAGCAIGLGNVWRFPYIAGEYGGALFVLIYIGFLVAVGLPIMVMEFAVGRASRKNMGAAFHALEPKGSKWHVFGCFSLIGSYVLMMFYTTVAGWMMAYCWYIGRGELAGRSPGQIADFFKAMLGDPHSMIFWMACTVAIGFVVCGMGVRNGVERVVKYMMFGLLILMLALVGRAVTLPGAEAGIRFYLLPDLEKMMQGGFHGLITVLNAAMGQAFFTLSLGIGAMEIFGSYIDKSRSLTGEAIHIAVLDTFVALMAGLIIFPACFAFGVDAGVGPGLIFVTLPNIFNSMAYGNFWGLLFFIFMSFAALSTVIAVFENIVSYFIDVWGWTRKTAVWFNGVLLFILSLPCALGFNKLSHIEPLGKGSGILDLEDFIVSNNLLPIGSLVFLLFCCQPWGWKWENFLVEADQGKGVRFPHWLKPYLRYVLPWIVILVLVQGYIDKLF